jgi:hypothetical protein
MEDGIWNPSHVSVDGQGTRPRKQQPITERRIVVEAIANKVAFRRVWSNESF